MGDANYPLGNQKLVSLIISLAAFVATFMMEGVREHLDLTSNLYAIKILNDFKNKTNNNQLVDKYRVKFCIQLK
jgi:hypothetical protein